MPQYADDTDQTIAPAQTLPPAPNLSFLGAPVSNMPGYTDQVSAPTDRVAAPWQVEDQVSYYRALTQMQQQQDQMRQQQLQQQRDQLAQQQANDVAQAQFSRGLLSTPEGENIATADPLFSYIGQLSNQKDQAALYNAAPYIRGQLQKGNDLQSVVQDVLGTPDQSTLEAAASFANIPGFLAQKALSPIIDPITQPAINALGNVPGIGGALQTGATMARSAVEQAPAFVLNPELFGAGQLLQTGATVQDWQQGKIDNQQALKQLAQIGITSAAPFVLRALPGLAQAAGKSVGDFLQSPEGQQAFQRVLTDERGSVGQPPDNMFFRDEQGNRIPIAQNTGSKTFPGQQPAVQGINPEAAAPQPPDVGGPDVGGQAIEQLQGQRLAERGRAPLTQGIGEDVGKTTAPPFVGGTDPVGQLFDRINAKNDAAQARAEMQQNRSDLISARTAQEEQYVHMLPDQLRQKALDLGAKPQDAELLGKTAQQIALAHLHDEPLLGQAPLSQRIAAAFEGTQPGVVGDLSLDVKDFGGALGITRNQWLNTNVDRITNAIEKDVPGLKYVGDTAREPFLDQLSSSGRYGYAIAHPNEFQGWSKAGLKAVSDLQSQGRGRYAIARTLDPTIAEPVGGNYLMRMYERPESQTMQPLVRPRGEVGVTQERAFKDEWQAYNAGYRFKQMPLKELIIREMQAVDQGSQDALMKREVLGRYGTRDAAAAKADGKLPVPTTAFPGDTKGWFLPPEITNRIQQMREPNQLAENPTVRGVSSTGKGVLTFPFDIGGLGVRIAELTFTNPHNLAAGIINRLLRDPAGVFSEHDLQREVALRSEGIQLGTAGSALDNTPLPGPVGDIAKKFSNATWGTTLGPMRGLAYEGNLALKRLLRQDISTETAAGVAARENSRDLINSFSGASRGAGNVGRAQVEARALLSPQTTRAMAAQFGQAAKLISPTAPLAERVNAAATIAAAGTSIWALQAITNMAEGKPIKGFEFPVTYDDKSGTFKYNGKWATIAVDGYHIPLLRQQTYINAMAQAFTTIANEAKSGDLADAVKHGDFSGFAPKLGAIIAPEAKAALGRLNVGPRAVMAGLGYGFDPNTGASLGHLDPTQRAMQAIPLPIPASGYLSKQPSSLGGYALEQATGAYPLSANEQLDAALKAHGVTAGINASPQEKFDARQKFPDVAKLYGDQQQAIQQQGGNGAVYSQAVQKAVTSQEKADTAFKNGTMTPQDWRTAFHKNQDGLQFLRDSLGIGKNAANNDPKVVQDYYKIFDQYPNANSDPAQQQAEYDALDQYVAKLSPDDQKTIDKYVGFGAGTTQTVREYRDTVSKLQKTGFYEAPQKVLQAYGYGQYKSIADLEHAAVESYVPIYEKAGLPAGMTEDSLRTLIANKIAGSRVIRLLSLGIEKQRVMDMQNDPATLAEAIKFGLAQSPVYIKEQILLAQQDQSASPLAGAPTVP